ncbi:MAG TPA: carbamoyltransferase HypF [Anaerolineaceae bacterium]
MDNQIAGCRIWITGIVQGVGFRPFIYNLAQQHRLTGWVKNTSAGVEIEVNGQAGLLDQFVQDIHDKHPHLARIDSLTRESVLPNGYAAFEIIHSTPLPGDFLPISPDIALCPDCERELFDPTNRRFHYPFINCTNCGPRFSIICDIPYDRPATTMAGFALCPECQREYEDPTNRRFHAQPIACPVCGPKVWLEQPGLPDIEGGDAIRAARSLMAEGKILAIKGLGGFHLACDAFNQAAVTTLRQRKKRIGKAFAVMAFSIEDIQTHCEIDPAESDLLTSPFAPIVLLKRKKWSTIAPAVYQKHSTLGVMLAYTPLHKLLLEPKSGFPSILVMTSGNLSDEPIAYQDEDCRTRLGKIADAYLMHNRPIQTRVDDSVSRIVNQKPYYLRRSRGYAPDPIILETPSAPMLATGTELKNTFTLAKGKYAFLSHYIGDLENYETYQSYTEGIKHFENLFKIKPEMIACDLHPDYLATQYAMERSQSDHLPIVKVQHHHAHLAACLADNHWNRPEPVIGIIFDGTGFGTDGTIWGGEILFGGYAKYIRRFHLRNTPLPGGNLAVRRPSRMALAHLWKAGISWGDMLPPTQDLCYEERLALRKQMELGFNSPDTSSMGRLFDAVSSLLGVCHQTTYEGQAAIELEAICDPEEAGRYELTIDQNTIDPAPLLTAIVRDWMAGIPVPRIATRFHNSIAYLCLDVSQRIKSESGLETIALSGGVWQNHFLLQKSMTLLDKAGFHVLIHQQTPPNDGSVSLGQVMVANHQNL